MSADGLHYAFWKLTLKAPGADGPDRYPVVSQMVLGSSPRRGTDRGRGRARSAASAAATVLLIASAAVACGDDSGGGDGSDPPEPSVEKTTGAPRESASAPADTAAAEKEVRANWEKFFDPEVSMKDKETVLENGSKMRDVLEGFSGDRRGKEVAAEVGKVEFTSPKAADVTYALTLKGATALPTASGTAVRQDDTWKVSVKTLCALVKLSGNASPGPGC
ncbi:hypothetical protein KY5_1647c [Streptomyces formicae]|uniref:Low molecular weight antigen MTB12-like C-terminal domain-containing protein n=2 Tax=Streptomyces formicae TaxID=1616117 RepID=A0A291Q5A2_9ACTN|nr:hypothetical protein KY5_1647c [Streptomyces formicae]